MNKKYLFIVLGVVILSFVVVFSFFDGTKDLMETKENKIQIVTTLFPLYDFAKEIGQEKVEVKLLLLPGVETHSYDPKPSDIAKINEADIFIYTGKFMEPWTEDVLKGVTNKNLKVVNSSDGIKMIASVFNDEDEPVGSMDPHIWLDFDNGKAMVQTITKALSEKDPINANYYEQKSEEYQNRLLELDLEYKTSLSNCASKEIVYGGHYAFGYLANRYGLRYLAAQGVSPDAEPTAQDLVALIEQIRKDNIKYVFYEELTSSKIAETLANETKTKILLLNAAHNITKEDFQNNVSFVTIMRANLANLKTGLQCSN